MYCKHCGANIPDDSKFCQSCGGTLQAAPGQAAQATPAQNPYAAPGQAPQAAPAKVNVDIWKIVSTVKKYILFVAAGVAAFALILAILNIFSTYDIPATMKGYGSAQTTHAPVSNVIKSDGYALVLIGNLLFGFVNLSIAVLCGLFFAQMFGVDLYKKLLGTVAILKSPFFIPCAAGAGIGLLQILFYAFSTKTSMGVTVSIGAHWTTWVAMFLYAGIAAADKFLLSKKG